MTDDKATSTETAPTVDSPAAEAPEATEPEGNTTDDVADTEESATEGSEAPDESESQSKREARYRIQLRETEAERDQLAAKVEALQRAEAERLAAKVIQKPGALWATDTSIADLLADDGTVDPQKVTKAATAAQQTLGLATTRPGGYVAREGTSLHESSTSGSAWERAFK